MPKTNLVFEVSVLVDDAQLGSASDEQLIQDVRDSVDVCGKEATRVKLLRRECNVQDGPVTVTIGMAGG